MPVSAADLAALGSRFSGPIIVPGDPQYDAARGVFNAMIDKRPAVIAQCDTSDDVVTALRFARDHGLEVAVRGGGHSVAGNALCDGGLVVDLRNMHEVTVDPAARIATIGGGATMSHLDRGTQPYGLATTGGRVSTTGAGGFTLGGGSGWLDRKFGLACDNLVSVEIVTADGNVITASADEHQELFWALHGGGGNFGVVTSMRLRLYPLTNVFGGLLIWPAEDGERVVRAFRDFVENGPDDVSGGAVFLTGPEAEFVPSEMQGRLALAAPIVFAGGEAEGRKALAPMLGLGHRGGFISEMAYADFNSMLDDPPGYRNYWSAEYLRMLPNEAIDVFCRRAPDMIVPSPSQHVLFPGGGKVARETKDWPVPWRTAPWCLHPFGLWSDATDDARGKAWARNVRADLKPWSTGDVYLNFIGAEGEDRVIAGFGARNYSRLQRVKAEYDPDNVFHINHNIRPALKAAE